MKSLHQIMDKYRYFCLWYTILGFVFFGRFIRGAFLPNSIANVNITGLFFCVLLVFARTYTRSWRISIKDLKFLLVIVVCSSLFFYTEIKNHIQILSQLKCYIGLVIPLILLHVQFEDEKVFIIFIKRFLGFFNLLVVLLLIWAVIDYFANGFIAKTVCALLNNSSLITVASSGRFTSFLGHPLFNTEIFLFYYVINAVTQNYIIKQKKFNYNFVAVLGILMTASKTGLVLILIGMILINITKPKKAVLLILLVGILYYLGFFDFVIERFLSGSLTSNRNEKWIETITRQDIDFRLMFGKGSGSVFLLNNSVSHASAAFEYPIRLFLYEFGILFTIIISIMLFIYPAWIFFKRKQYIVLIGFLILMIDVNTYNGLGLYHDYMYVYCAFTCILLNLSNYIIKNDN